jgi:UPF0755 protein
MTKTKKIIIAFVALVMVLGLIVGIDYYIKIFGKQVRVEGKQYLYIPTGSTREDVIAAIKREHLVRNTETFAWLADRMNYTKVKPGKYRLKNGMSNLDLVRMLRAGDQEPVKIQFQNYRIKTDFAAYLDEALELDAATLLSSLDSIDMLREVGLDEESSFALFIPNTYEFYWNTDAVKFIEKMKTEYQTFWNESRRAKAKKIGLSPAEVSILASIVDQEALLNSEMPRIAGVYMNRLQKDMKLEADPTVVFAIGNFEIKRVLNRMLNYDSPYNTYRYKGLPPGPICMPSVAAIDAVLNYEQHQYIYFCAKEDFSGYHNFARTLQEHEQNAKKFQRALSKKGILK